MPSRRKNTSKQVIMSVPYKPQKVAAPDSQWFDELIKAFTRHGTIKPVLGGNRSVKGTIRTLKHYQIMETSFIRKRGDAAEYARGGRLADEKGLGKTAMTL